MATNKKTCLPVFNRLFTYPIVLQFYGIENEKTNKQTNKQTDKQKGGKKFLDLTMFFFLKVSALR